MMAAKALCMRYLGVVSFLLATVLVTPLAAPLQAARSAASSTVPGTTIFDPDPNHIWNRTYACIFIRQSANGMNYGSGALDPPLWDETRHLLTGDSHRRALACLDEFLTAHAERLIRDRLKRALLQRDLWAVFDWAGAGDAQPHERRELQLRLAQAMHRVALTKEEIHALPDSYADTLKARLFPLGYKPGDGSQPFLPDLFSSNSPWLCISAFLQEPTAISHFSGRSRFLVFLRLPGGRDATFAYVQKLRSWPEPALLKSPSGAPLLNLSLPQFPPGTMVALVRQAILIDTDGDLTPTALTESVQLRVYHTITPGPQYMNYINGPSSHDQDFFEFRLNRPDLFANKNGGLSPVLPGDLEYATFGTHGRDPFESGDHERQGAILARCLGCHVDSGIQSVQSRTQWVHHPVSEPPSEPIDWETDVTLARKRQQSDFQLLEKILRTQAN